MYVPLVYLVMQLYCCTCFLRLYVLCGSIIYCVYLCVLDASVSCLYVTELLSWSLKKKNVESVMELDTS